MNREVKKQLTDLNDIKETGFGDLPCACVCVCVLGVGTASQEKLRITGRLPIYA